MVSKMRYELIMWVMAVLKMAPGRIGCCLRRLMLPCKMGKSSKIWDNVHIDSPGKLIIGERCSINRGTTLNCGGGIEIHNNVLIGPGVVIYSQNHRYMEQSYLILEQGYHLGRVVVESDTWLAANCIVLPGVTISRGSIVAAGAVVTKSTEPYGVYAGSPARKIKARI